MRALVLAALFAASAQAQPAEELLARSAAAQAAGDADAAWQLAAQAVRRYPREASVRARAAGAALAVGRFAEAQAEAEEAMKLGGPTAALHQTRSSALSGLGRAEEALAEAEAGLKLNPASAAGELRRARAAESLGRKDAALESYRRAADFDAALTPELSAAESRLLARRSAPLWPFAAGGLALLGAAAWAMRRRGRRGGARSMKVRFASVVHAPKATDELRGGGVVGGRYIVGGVLRKEGSGAAQVFEGRDLEDSPVLIRRYLPSLEPRRSFRLDRALAARDLKHPALEVLEAVFEENGWGFAVVPARGSETLADALEKTASHRLTPAAVVRGARSMCEALDASHAAGLVHGRLKTSDVILSPEGWILGGLGLPGAAAADAPPEGDPETKEGDLYALAVCLYSAVAGEAPFAGPDAAAARREGRPASLEGRSGLPAGIDAFFRRALHPDPARRFRCAAEVYGALRSLVDPAVH